METDRRRGIADPESLSRLAINAARTEVVARNIAAIVIPQHAAEIFGRAGGDFPQPLPRVRPRAMRVRCRDVDPRLLGHQADGAGPIHPQPLGQEGEDIATLVAHEAVVHVLLRGHREIRVRALMERARAAVVRAQALEGYVLADDLDDVRLIPDALDQVVGNQRRAPPAAGRGRTVGAVTVGLPARRRAAPRPPGGSQRDHPIRSLLPLGCRSDIRRAPQP